MRSLSLLRLRSLVWIEWSELRQDGWQLSMLLGFVVGLLLTSWVSYSDYKHLGQKLNEASAEARENWLHQGDRNPHGAAHHGTFLFREVPDLAWFCPGLFPHQGSSLRIEAHVRHRLTNRPGENDIQILTPTFASPAQLIFGIQPLLLILIGFSSIPYERQNGNLALIHSSGVSWQLVSLSKIVFLLSVAFLMTLPVMLGLMGIHMIRWQPEMSLTNHSFSVIAIVLTVTLFQACWCSLIVAVSSRCRTSLLSLSSLFVLWTLTSLCAPSMTTSLTAMANPLPSQEQVKKWSDKRKYDSVNGNIFKTVREDLEKEMLEKYGVQSTAQLPFKFDGLVMQEAEKLTDQMYESDATQLAKLQAPYGLSLAWCGMVSPFLCASHLSSNVIGTDEIAFADFDSAAEEYRQYLVQIVNKADAQLDGPDALRGEELWKSVEPFEEGLATRRSVLLSPLLTLSVWTYLGMLIALIPPSNAYSR